VPLDNHQGNLIPGSFVIGEIIIAETNAPLLVRKSALQLLEDQSVVFVKGHDGFEPRAVQLGRSDTNYVEVLSGLENGETYVTDNSFVLKSELGKEDMEDEH
jgi:cobalt-zinc-cadmium efflux system membrane fusion protein